MSWNGSGTYTPPTSSFPESNGTTVDATRYDATINDIAAGITAALAKNGENSPTANLPMGGFKHTGAASAAGAGQYVVWGQNGAALGTNATDSLTINGTTVTAPNGLTFGGLTTGMLFEFAGQTKVDQLLGVGVTPSAWGASYSVLQMPAGSLWADNAGTTLLQGQNAYFDGTNYLYIANGPASLYTQSAGAHQWSAAVSGTAAGTISWVTSATLDARGNLALKMAPDTWNTSYTAFQLASGSLMSSNAGSGLYMLQNVYYGTGNAYVYKTTNKASNYTQNNGMHLFGVAPSGTGGTAATFTYPVAIDNNGNLLVGTTSSLWNSAGRGLVEINGTAETFLGFRINGANGGYIYHDGTNINFVNSKSGGLVFGGGAFQITHGGVLQDSAGLELGWKGIPQTTGGLANGECYQISGGVTATTSSANNTFMLFNNSAAAVTITQGTGLTMRLAGSALTGNRTLAAYGLAFLMYATATTCVISGNVS